MAAKELKLISYNIHKGFSPTKRRYTLELLRESIRLLDLDLVFLQEVVGENRRNQDKLTAWPKAGQFEYLADTFWDHYAYGKNSVYQDGHHGNAILSKYPIIEWENVDVSTNRLEKRGVMYARISVPVGEKVKTCIQVHLFNLHFNMLFGQFKQQDRLCGLITDKVPEGEPVIVSGDFNDWSGFCSRRLKLKTGLVDVTTGFDRASTFPAPLPVLALDRVFSKNLKVLEAGVPRLELEQLGEGSSLLDKISKKWRTHSDHLPIVSRIAFE